MLAVVNQQESLQSRTETEREVIRALCSDGADTVSRTKYFEMLSRYKFIEPEHRVIFDALRSLRASDTSTLRERLIIRLNNLGFPDLDLAPFFLPASLSRDAALLLVRRLAELEDGLAPQADNPQKST
jgi:hypothetical protein